MKKHFLFLAMALLAISGVHGQTAVHNTAPSGITCPTDDPLNPIVGKKYIYSASANPATGNFTWWATQDKNFITGTGTTNNIVGKTLTVADKDLSFTSDKYSISDAATSVEIIWGSSMVTKTTATAPTFVAAYFTGSGTTCADNLKVYQVTPKNAFTIEIAPMKGTGTAVGNTLAFKDVNSSCVSPIASATFVTDKMVYDYGTNVVYYEVVAANFTDSWTASLSIAGLNAGQSVDIDWSYDPDFESGNVHNFASGVTANGIIKSGTPATAVTTQVDVAAGFDTSVGVSVYFRLTVHNGTWETLIDNDIVLAVDGKNASGLDDQTEACADELAFADAATQKLTPRPTVTSATGSPVKDFVQP